MVRMQTPQGAKGERDYLTGRQDTRSPKGRLEDWRTTQCGAECKATLIIKPKYREYLQSTYRSILIVVLNAERRHMSEV
jgi:hypothetical protein